MRGLIANIANFITEIYTNRLTALRAGYLDLLNTRLDTLVSSRADGATYTAGRAANLDNLNATITSRAAPADITAALAGGISAVAGIRAVNGTTAGTGAVFDNAGIAAVGAKAIVVSACCGDVKLSAKLTSTTNVRIDYPSGDGGVPYSFYVIDFK